MKNRIMFTLAIIMVCLCNVYSQTKVQTPDGRSVVLNDDGTWKYEEVAATTTATKNLSSCSELITESIDKMTGAKSVSSSSTLIVSEDTKNGFGIFLMILQKGTFVWATQVVGGGGCIDDDDKMNILFRDGSKLELVNNTKFNCEGNFTLYFGGVFGKKAELKQLQEKEISTIRIWTSKSYVQEDFTDEQAKEFKATINCLTNQ